MRLGHWVRVRPVLLALALFAANSAVAQTQYTITTFAGGAPPPTPNPAINLSLVSPNSVVTDSAGNFYLTSQYSVFKVNASGVMTLLAGIGRPGSSGDGGPASSAALSVPSGLALDSTGNLYIASGQVIRKVTPSGAISTFAGAGTYGFSGDGGPAVSAQLFGPANLAFDADGNLYIADTGNARVRKISPGGTISTFAGNGSSSSATGDGGPAASAGIPAPYGLAFDTSGNLYISDFVSNTIRKVATSGIISTIAGNGTNGFAGDGGPAISAESLTPARHRRGHNGQPLHCGSPEPTRSQSFHEWRDDNHCRRRKCFQHRQR